MGKSAKFHKRFTRKERKVQAEISNISVTSKSASQDPLLNIAKPSVTTKVTKNKKRKKKVQSVTTDAVDDDKNERDYVDVFTGKKSYKP
ncbi:9946_t:CDS:2 [Funneliformis geosporum]|uniref:16363_t:CDS:1 n=1 Tax=Funneliformis geosporum TaxID=1117311 RepID=A0A9W4SUE1_9GLOM|nr:9946_t:CDS:2 [Funneliformis geosporum]CAI2180927.1 16363_t:CDS:2 [Funneliformis geosporum]